jgi:solute carrier family 25, member 42
MIAGGSAKFVTAPLDRVRILYQVNPERHFNMRSGLKTARTIWNNTGILGLWRGNNVVMMRVMPYAGMQFCAFAR